MVNELLLLAWIRANGANEHLTVSKYEWSVQDKYCSDGQLHISM